MGTYNIHAGHAPYNTGAYGAVGILNESNEVRKVKDTLITMLKNTGNTVYDCTCDMAYTQDEVLKYIVNLCNQHTVDLDISIHLNSGRNDYTGDGSTGGVEVYIYDDSTREISEKICKYISEYLGIRNRGVKVNKDLYVLKNTKNKAILIECCFADDKDDADKWDTNICATAITRALINEDELQLHYRGHVQGTGWDKVKATGEMAGTTGQSKRLEAVKIDYPGHLIYAKAHVQGIGDVDYGLINSDTVIGTTGQSKRLEALWLKGDIKARVHIQNKGWTDWVDMREGVWVGTKGQSLRLEAVEIERI